MKDQKYYFRVKYGFGATEYAVITQDDLSRAIYAQLNGTVVLLNGLSVNGKHIIYIKPDVHRYTGWNEGYEPKDADDFRQIQRDVPKEIETVQLLAEGRVRDFARKVISKEQFDTPLLRDVNMALLLQGEKDPVKLSTQSTLLSEKTGVE